MRMNGRTIFALLCAFIWFSCIGLFSRVSRDFGDGKCDAPFALCDAQEQDCPSYDPIRPAALVSKSSISKEYVVISATKNADYLFLIPLTAAVWKYHIGFEPIIIMCVCPEEDKAEDNMSEINVDRSYLLVLEICTRHGFIVEIIEDCGEIPNVLASQASRLFATLLPYITENDYVLLSDADMFPLSKEHFVDARDLTSNVQIFNAFIMQEKEYAMCYVGASKKNWFDLMGFEEIDNISPWKEILTKYVGQTRGWGVDQRILTAKLKAYMARSDGRSSTAPKVQKLDRDWGSNTEHAGMRLADRIDRLAWRKRQPGDVDAHLPRGAWKIEDRVKVFNLLADLIPRNVFADMVVYANDFTNPPPLPVEKTPFVVVTTASKSYETRLFNLIGSLHVHEPEVKIIVYNLGMTEEQLRKLATMRNVELRLIQWNRYPRVVRNLYTYGWKPLIWKETLEDFGSFLFLDAGIEIRAPIGDVFRRIQETGCFLGWQGSKHVRYTHPNQIIRLGFPNYKLFDSFGHCAGGMVGMTLHHPRNVLQNYLMQLVECSMDTNCILPKGSGWENHRYEQSAETVVAQVWKYSCRPELLYLSNDPKAIVVSVRADAGAYVEKIVYRDVSKSEVDLAVEKATGTHTCVQIVHATSDNALVQCLRENDNIYSACTSGGNVFVTC